MRVIKSEWYLLGPYPEGRETDEAEGLKPEEAAGTEATKLPGHNPQKRTRVLNSPGRLPSAGQYSDIHKTLLLLVRVCRCSECCTSLLRVTLKKVRKP